LDTIPSIILRAASYRLEISWVLRQQEPTLAAFGVEQQNEQTRGSRADALRILNVGGIFARSLCEPNGPSRDKDSK
jgi:predicted acetyltransferase